MTTQGWIDAVRTQPEDVVILSQLLASPPAESRSLPEKEKNSRLIQAAKEDAVDELQTLLAAGADVRVRDEGERRWTALHWAAENGHEKTARCLVEGGAEVEATSINFQETPLHRAAYRGHEAVARLLLEAGVEVDARNKTQSTPLHLAAYHGHEAVVRLLLAATPYHNARNQWGQTPLHSAALNGHTEVAAALLEAGADRWARNNEGKTPLDLARQNNHQQLIDILKLAVCIESAVRGEMAAEVRHIPESSTMEPTQEVMETTAVDLGALLDAGDGAVVTLVAGGTRLVAHRAVLADRSPVFGAMFRHDTLEATAGEVAIPDVEGPVLRQLVAYLYTLQAPQLPSLASHLLAAADKYGVSALKARCEQHVAAQLSVETAAATAVLAIRHSSTSLRQAAVNFIKANAVQVMTTQGWIDAVRTQPEDVVILSQLLASPPAESRSLPEKEKNSRLIQAAKEDAVDELQTLLAAGADVRVRDEGERRWTALHWAAENGHEKTARCLVEGGAEVEARSINFQETPLHRAAYRGHEAVARLLLEAGAEADARNKMQCTPLLIAALAGHVAVVRLLLAATPYHNARDQWGRTPLHHAALNGHAEVAAALLEAGADRWARNNEGKTPLDLARQNNHQQLIDILKLAHRECHVGERAAESSTMEPTKEVMETTARDLGALLDAGDGAVVTLVAGGTRLVAHRAVLADRSPVFGGMFRHDTLEANTGEVAVPDVEGPVLRQLVVYLYTLQAPQLPSLAPQLLAAADKYGVSALKARCEQFVAAQLSVKTAAAAAVLAISAPASTDGSPRPGSGPQGDRGHTPATAAPPTASRTAPPPDDSAVSRLRSLPEKEKNSRLVQAAKEDSVSELQTLLAVGADVGAREESEDRWTTLHWAANKGHVKAARCLVEGGADVDAKCSSWQETPLHRATFNGHKAVAQLLLEAGAEADARNKTQSTPLLLAAEKGHVAVVRLLLAATPYHNARNQWGRTPLHNAALHGHAEMASALLDAGADRWARNNDGKTPLDLARQNNHQQLIDMLRCS
ncbi:ankyrin-3-like [Schistocerca serialis cubense]|uniref:ankyrin-3-like n=1 Tax=Schistocerca serialis cubense TaxID=2023355 RepID=UPI00214E14A7|nr:ankyrin-3-like [Schistocerca serialis cubense]